MAKLKNAKQERFCQEYLVDANGTQAAIRAGYSERSARSQASELLRKPDVLARVKELQAEKCKRLGVDADWMVLKAVDMYDRCMQKEQVMAFDYEAREMVPTGEWQFDSRGAGKALEIIGKVCGLFTDNLNINTPLPVIINDLGDG